MSNLITEIYDKQAVVDNLNQLGELINSSLNAIVSSAPKLQSPIEYLTAVQSISEIEKKNTEVTQAKAKAMSDLDKAYQQADKAIQQSINLEDAEFQTQTKLTSQYKERAKEQRQLLELERTRQQTMQNGNKLLQMEAKSEAELRMQQQQLIKAQQSLRVTNAEENALREKLIAKINANKEALKGMSDEVSKQRDNIGNYKSALDGVVTGQIDLREAMALTRKELQQLETLQATGTALTAEQRQRYNDLNNAMGQMKDIQGDISARTKALSNDYLGMNTALEGVKLGVNIMTSLQSVTALLGGENEELQKAMAKVVATQQILNTVTQIQKQLNKDSDLMTGLVALKHKFLTTQIIAETKAQTALNAAKLGLVGAVAAAVGALGYMIVKMASAQNATADLSAELNKQASEAIGNDVAKITELKSQWDKLGGTMDEKRAYLEKYNSKLEELGLHFDNVNQLETFMNEHTKDYVDAITARAKADAARSILAEKTSEYVKNELDFERQNIQGQQTFWEKMQRFVLDFQVGRTEASKMVREAYEAEQKDMQDQIDTTIELINKYQEEADTLFAGLPVKEDDKKKTKEQTQANKDLKLSLEELQEQEEEWAKTQLNAILKDAGKNLAEQMEATIKLIEAKKKLNEEAVNSIEIDEEEAEKVETLTEMTKRLAKEQAEALKERTEAIQSAKENLTEAFTKITDLQLDNLERESDAYDENYERRRQVIENTVMSEAEKDRRLKALDNEKTAHDKQVAKERAQIERRQAIFKNAIQSAEAISNAVASVGLLLRKETEGDTYSAIARYIAAIAAGVSAVTTVASLISKILQIPAFAKGGTAEANKPFIAGEKGREIGFGVHSGKVYDFSKPTLFKANEPINIKNATETRQIINNNEYNKDVTLHNEVVVQVIDNTRVKKYFKLGGKA
ncbi:MAG: hypothetical protein II663_05515 [Bacteroidales bacterium]|nr:hypothetical protein [Bacteroidales bacterium]